MTGRDPVDVAVLTLSQANPGRAPLAVVYGGGGPYATAFGMGAAVALLEHGVPLLDAPRLGTSGGAWAGAAIGARLTHERVLEVTSRIRLAASSAVPLMVPPQRIGRGYYIDGGARSWVSADLAVAADRLLVLAPGISPALGPFGRALSRQLTFEIRRWKRRTGGQAFVLRPEHQLGRRVKRWGDMFDARLAREAYQRAQGQTLGAIASGGGLSGFVA